MKKSLACAVALTAVSLFSGTVEYTPRVTSMPRQRGAMVSYFTTEKDLEDLRLNGANVIRYQILHDWKPSTPDLAVEELNAWLPKLFARLDTVLSACERLGMRVIVDLHSPPGGKNEKGSHRIFFEKEHADRFVETWMRLAAHLRGRKAVYGYDLVNEPIQWGKAPFGFLSLQKRAAEAIRRVDPETPIVVAADCGDLPCGFKNLDEIGLKDIIYEVHMYEPHRFTHQGVLKDCPNGVKYPDGVFNRAALEKALEPVVAFQKKTGARILVGEFSAVSWAEGADAYLRDVIEIFEMKGWDWCYHAWREWEAWSVEHEGMHAKTFAPSADNPRKRALLDGWKRNAVTQSAHYDVAAIVWPAYQNDPRWKELSLFPEGEGEWQNVRESRSRFKGDGQPYVPLWGYGRDDDPVEMARQIDAATSAGINVFVYDWYWYEGRPFLENALNRGFLGAANADSMRFYLMWANHPVNNLWDNKAAKKSWEPNDIVWDGKVTGEEFKTVADRWITRYFSRKNYYRIDGKPVVMIYDIANFVNGVGGVDEAAASLAYLRRQAKAAGHPGVHVQFVLQRMTEKPEFAYTDREMRLLAPDSMTVYNWAPYIERIWDPPAPGELFPTYAKWMEQALSQHDRHRQNRYGIGYYPNVTIGWDTNARFPADTACRYVTGASPALFEKALRRTRAWLDRTTPGGCPKLLLINAWNEWTEGSYLMPDTHFGYGYLDAVRRVFGRQTVPMD